MKTGLATRERACDGSDGRRESNWLGEVRHASGRFPSGGQGVPVIGSPDEVSQKGPCVLSIQAECGIHFLDELRSRDAGEMGGLDRNLGSRGKGQFRLGRLEPRGLKKNFQERRNPQARPTSGCSQKPLRAVPHDSYCEEDSTYVLI